MYICVDLNFAKQDIRKYFKAQTFNRVQKRIYHWTPSLIAGARNTEEGALALRDENQYRTRIFKTLIIARVCLKAISHIL